MQPMEGEVFQERRAHRARKVERKLARKAKHKARRLTRHHNFAKSLGGRGNGYKGDEDFIAMLTAEHHALFHKLFGLRTFKQAAEVLLRLDRIKEEE